MTLLELYFESTRTTLYILGEDFPIRYDTRKDTKYDNRHVKSVTTVGNINYVELWKD